MLIIQVHTTQTTYQTRNKCKTSAMSTTQFMLKQLNSVSQLVSWFFKPSQPQRIISGLMETVIKRYTVERTNEAEIRPEEQSERVESCRENVWNEITIERAIKTEIDTRG